MRDIRLFSKIGTDWREIDLYDNIDMTFNFQVSDIKDISKKDTNYSYTITIPNTTNNANTFEHCYEIGAMQQTFQMLEPYPCYVVGQNTMIFQGLFKMTKIIRNNGEIYYEGLVYSQVKHFFDELGEETLRGNSDSSKDLDFSEYSFNLSLANIADKFTSLPYDTNSEYYNPNDLQHSPLTAKGCGMTLIDKTDLGNTSDIGYSGMSINCDQLSPYLYVKEIWDKIFEQKGYKYVSRFLDWIPVDSQYNDIKEFPFRRLIYPYASPSFTWDDDCSLGIKGTGSYFDSDVFYVPGGQQPTTASGMLNWLNKPMDVARFRFNYVNNRGTLADDGLFLHWSPSVAGRYHFTTQIPFKLALQYNWYVSTYDPPLNKYIGSSVYVRINDNSSYYVIMHAKLRTNTGRILATKDIEVELKDGDEFQLDPTSPSAPEGHFYVVKEDTLEFDDYFNILPGETVELVASYHVPYRQFANSEFIWHSIMSFDVPMYPSPVLNFPAQANGYELVNLECVGENFVEGINFNPTLVLNPKTRKTDFIKDIITMFNLYVEDISGKDNGDGGVYDDRTLLIEPYTMYYFDSDKTEGDEFTTFDWSRKIDNKHVEMSRSEDYLHKSLNFTFVNDKDFWVQTYSDKFKEEYSCRTILKGDGQQSLEIPLKAGQTYCGLFSENNNEILAPRIYTFDNKGLVQTNKLYSDRYMFVYRHFLNHGKIVLKSTTSSNVRNCTYYTVCDVVNSFGDDATACLMWDSSDGLQNAYGWDAHPGSEVLTERNLYTVFWNEMVARYASPTNRIITANFYLDFADIYRLRLSNTVVINAVKFFVLSVSEWTSPTEPCEVTLMMYTPISQQDITDTRSKNNNIPKNIEAKNVLAESDTINDNFNVLAEVLQQTDNNLLTGVGQQMTRE